MSSPYHSPLTKAPYSYGLPSPLRHHQREQAQHKPSTALEAELPYFATAIARAKGDTEAFAAELENMMPAASREPPAKGAGRAIFDSFDVDGSGCLGFDEVLLGVKAFGLKVSDPAEVRALFDAADKDGSNAIDLKEFERLVEGVASLRQGRALDVNKLAAAARTLHAQALQEPLALVAEGEIPTLLRCASSGHAAVEQLGLAALAAVAEAPYADASAAIVARAPQLSAVLSSLNQPDARLASVRQGARLLAALCSDAGEAKELEIRRRLRLRLYQYAAPLLHGNFGRRCAKHNDSAEVVDDSNAAQGVALCLAAFASEQELALRMATDGAGGALQLMCQLAGSADATTRSAGVEAICSCASAATSAKEKRERELGAGGWAADEAASSALWKLVGFGAIPPLLLAASLPCTGLAGDGQIAQTARRALELLHYDSLWKGASKGADPLLGHHSR